MDPITREGAADYEPGPDGDFRLSYEELLQRAETLAAIHRTVTAELRAVRYALALRRAAFLTARIRLEQHRHLELAEEHLKERTP